MISAVVAVDNNWGIGYNGDLLEHIPGDLKYFKELTSGYAVVMGRKTWDSLPKKPLPNRHNLVITKDPSIYELTNEVWFYTLRQIEVLMLKNKNVNYFVIGGGQIYEKLLPICDRVYVTKIFKDHDQVDTYFPNLDESDEWAPAMQSALHTYKDLTYQFWQYDRI
jgi:dihydrofolate reductase